MQLPLAITATDALALVQLRSLLDEARQASYRTGEPRRMIATVLLDAVNEAALNLVATSLGMSATHRDNFDGLKGKVESELSGAWNAVSTTWRDVNRLHGARNLAQHHSVRPDASQILAWRAATEQFANSLISVVFGKRLDAVELSDAIIDSELRATISQAEAYLKTGESGTAASKAFAAFDVASKRWRRQSNQLGRHGSRKPSSRSIVDDKSFDYLEELAKAALELAQHQVFGTSPSDFLWFNGLTRERAENITLEEAERAVSFAFWWIVDWEAAAPAFVENRRRRQLKASRVVRATTEPARISGISVDDYSVQTLNRGQSIKPDRYRVDLRCENVPSSDDEFAAWQQALRSALASSLGIGRVHVDDAGTISIHFDPSNDDVNLAVDAVGRALLEVEHAVRELRRNEELAIAARQAEHEEFLRKVEALREGLPTWVIDIRPGELQDFGGGDSCRVLVAPDMPTRALIDLLSRREGIDRVARMRDHVLILPRLDPEVLSRLLNEAGPSVEAQKQEADGLKAVWREQIQSIEQEFHRLMQP